MLYDYRRHETIVIGGVGPFGTKLVANDRMFYATGETANLLSGGSRTVEGAVVYDGFHDIYIGFGGNNYLEEIIAVQSSPEYERFWYPGLAGFPDSYNPADLTVFFCDGRPSVGPARRVQCAMVYDEKRRVTVLFGGVGGGRYGDTWELVTVDLAEAWVHFGYQGRELGTFDLPYNTLGEAVAWVANRGVLKIKAGSTTEPPFLSKPMTLDAHGGPVVIGRTRP
jgi:hypothetical protein